MNIPLTPLRFFATRSSNIRAELRWSAIRRLYLRAFADRARRLAVPAPAGVSAAIALLF